MIINDLDGYYIVFDTKNWNTELDTLIINPIIAKTIVKTIPKYIADTVPSWSVFIILKSAANPPKTMIVYVDLLMSKKYLITVSLINLSFSFFCFIFLIVGKVTKKFRNLQVITNIYFTILL